jgi:hypothetical protein
MPNVETQLDDFEVRDLEDNSMYRVVVQHCTELGNKNKPGIRIKYSIGGAAYFCVYEPWTGEKLAYEAKKAGGTLVRKDKSWERYEDRWLRNSLVIDGDKLKARIEIKVRSSDEPVVKEYALPFVF